uniref:Uncharacterized protein n=1 Tax=Branchiostoma floridae TaxID=7739 RepID=C3YEE9_BRAFL|eukprot:XP_002605447.1 hypothetical protein BRAFLDRAFT_74262 [Branchiostoma floridae]
MAQSKFALIQEAKKRQAGNSSQNIVPQKQRVPEDALPPELLVKVKLGIMSKETARDLVQKVVHAEKKLFTDEVFSDLTRLSQTLSVFKEYKAQVYSIGSGCFILGLVFLQISDVDTFYHEHYKIGPGTLSEKLTGILISDSLRSKVNGADLIVRFHVKHEDYLRVRRRLEKAQEKESRPLLNSLDLAATRTQDSNFADWATDTNTKQLVLKMKQKSQALTGLEAKHEIAQRQVELQEGMVRGLQGKVKELTEKQETAQKVLLDNKKEIEDLTGANKGMEETIEGLLAEKTKLTNKLAMMESERLPRTRAAGEATSASKPTEPTPAGQETSVLLVNDVYGAFFGGTSTVNRQVAQFLLRHGATVHCTALQASEENKRCATEDGVILHLPIQNPRDKRTPSLEWLTFDHTTRYQDIPHDLKCIVGHAGVTSKAAKNMQQDRCPHAKLFLFNHDMPEDTEYYKGAQKAMAAGKTKQDILEDAMNADAVFSLGSRIYDHFEVTYKSLGDSKPREHLMFLPRPSSLFEAISVRPGGGEKVVLTVGRVTEVEKLEGHDLVARAIGEAAEKIPNVKLRVRGIDEDVWEASKKILEENLHSGRIKPTLLPCGTQEDIAQDMQQAHLVLMPSRAEPFGMIGLEAIAAGVPVLISDKSGLADMIKDLIMGGKCHADMRHRIVRTSVRESDLDEDAKRWAEKIVDTLEYSELEFERAAEYKKQLLESKYWEESHQNLLRVCELIE